jgi:hypothetical protein
MRSLTLLPEDQLKDALGAADALMEHKAFLPPGSLLFMLLGKFRDDTREALGMKLGELPQRGRERRSLDEMTTTELAAVIAAVAVLSEARFTGVMDDPALPRLLADFRQDLTAQDAERAQLRASVS